ncbi:MAG: glycosyltransferase [Clostridia bacterium]|nr:glycosyltransferase [Clostridia bacterium]
MNLLLLTSSLGCGGAETHIVSLAKELVRRGHQVTVASAGGALTQALSEGGVKHRTISLSKRNPFSLLMARHDLRRLLKKECFDLIHAHARIPAALASPLAKKKRIPLVTTVHARFRSGFFPCRFSRWGERSVAVSEDLKHHLSTVYHVPSDHIRVIPNGIDTQIFCPNPKATDDARLRLVFVSRLDKDCSRGAFLLCRMAKRLLKKCPHLEICIAGGGDALPALRRLVNRINEEVGTRLIRLCGYVEDLRPLYHSADGVIGVSRVALEAMACAIPVILAGNEGMLGLANGKTVSRAAASNFCCRDGKSLNEDALEHEILRLLSMSREMRARLGQALADYVKRRHDLSVIVKQTEDFYRQALARRPSATPADLILCGYYGYGNVGDDALLHAAICRAEEQYPDYTVSALTRRGKKDEARFGIRCVRRTNPLAVAKELRHARVLVFGGGTLLQDQTSLRSLLYYAALLRLARRHGLRTELWGNGLSIPRTAKGEQLIVKCLLSCHHIGLRDSWSLAWGLSHTPDGVRGRFFLEKDLAEGTPSCSVSRTDYICRLYLPQEAPLGFGIVTVHGRIGRGYLKILLSWLSVLRGEGIHLVFVPMLPEEDERLCRRLAALYRGTVTSDLSPSDLVGLMSRARIVCGMRLHSLVFAASAGTPFVGFGNDPKIESFCRERGGIFFTDLY